MKVKFKILCDDGCLFCVIEIILFSVGVMLIYLNDCGGNILIGYCVILNNYGKLNSMSLYYNLHDVNKLLDCDSV